ncbi:hypothetical protein [Cryobacterium algoritolerans]|uniref:hypothetical protein n=1 Tax=Cryobacterium algoritolerans TaxID=1259184 RepID=UPI00141AF71C|nr:hypothetical protein [Cryobacterium algoritolerans]
MHSRQQEILRATGSVFSGFPVGQIVETAILKRTIASVAVIAPADNGVQLNVRAF